MKGVVHDWITAPFILLTKFFIFNSQQQTTVVQQ